MSDEPGKKKPVGDEPPDEGKDKPVGDEPPNKKLPPIGDGNPANDERKF